MRSTASGEEASEAAVKKPVEATAHSDETPNDPSTVEEDEHALQHSSLSFQKAYQWIGAAKHASFVLFGAQASSMVSLSNVLRVLALIEFTGSGLATALLINEAINLCSEIYAGKKPDGVHAVSNQINAMIFRGGTVGLGFAAGTLFQMSASDASSTPVANATLGFNITNSTDINLLLRGDTGVLLGAVLMALERFLSDYLNGIKRQAFPSFRFQQSQPLTEVLSEGSPNRANPGSRPGGI